MLKFEWIQLCIVYWNSINDAMDYLIFSLVWDCSSPPSYCLPFSLETTFVSGPVLVMILEKENAISDWRALIGPTDAKKAKTTHPHRLSSVILLLFCKDPSRLFVFI